MHAEILRGEAAWHMQLPNVQQKSMCTYIYIERERERKCGKMLTIEKLINLGGQYRSVSCIILGDFL